VEEELADGDEDSYDESEVAPTSSQEKSVKDGVSEIPK